MLERVRKLNDAPANPRGRYILYWAQMNRRAEYNHALSWAALQANQRGLPLLVYEGLTCTYKQANDRMHSFVLEAVPGNARRFRQTGAGYCFYLRRKKSDPNHVLYQLAKDAVLLVTDDYPVFIAADHNTSVPPKLPVPYFAVDSSCIVPMNLFPKREYAAYTFRPKIHRRLEEFMEPVGDVRLEHPWQFDPLEWHTEVRDQDIAALVASCDIDHNVPPSVEFRGGRQEAERRLTHFLKHNLPRYEEHASHPSERATSGLSPYLHFGQISSLEVALRTREHARQHRIDASRFLEELIVRRELAFNYAFRAGSPESFDHLPDWVKADLEKHRDDERETVYTRREFETAATADSLWNATQRELLLTGKIHGYYRMYWGKKIIEWSKTYKDALDTMVFLHDRYALDGRDANTITNILWCFGLHDRPWSERPVFGRIRYMSYGGMKRKTNIEGYMAQIEQMERESKNSVAATSQALA